MMTEPPVHATSSPGAGMDRRVARPARPWWRQRRAIVAAAVVLAAVALWRLLPAAGSTDVAAADVETGVVARAPFADYLPVRATVAPRVTTLVGVLSGGQVEALLAQDGATVTAGQPVARLANPSLRLEVLSREAQIAGQLGDVSGQDLSLERQIAEARSGFTLGQATRTDAALPRRKGRPPPSRQPIA